MVYAQIRYFLKTQMNGALRRGVHLLAQHISAFQLPCLPAIVLYHLKRLGGIYSDEEGESLMAVWRYASHLMGIPETILYRDEAESLEAIPNWQEM